MDWFVKAFLKASLVWLGLGVTLGVGMAAKPAWIVYRPAHFHMTLLGFVASTLAYVINPALASNGVWTALVIMTTLTPRSACASCSAAASRR